MKRWLTVAMTALALSTVFAVGLPAQTAQAAISPAAPDPINILPSVYKSVFNKAVPKEAAALAVLIYSMAQSKEFWAAVSAEKAGTATTAQKALAAPVKAKWSFPAAKVKPIVKGVGPMLAFDIGFSYLGDGVLEVLSVDETGLVCQQAPGAGRDMLSLFQQVDCNAWDFEQSFVPNLGVVPAPPGFKRPTMWWGGEANIPNPSWVGNALEGVVNGRVFTITIRTEVATGTTGSGSVSPLTLRCKSSTTNSFTNQQSNQILVGKSPVGAVATSTATCPTGYFPYAYGREDSNAGNPNVITDGGVRLQNDAGDFLWFNPVSPNYEPGYGANPERRFKCLIKGSNGTNYTGYSEPFFETDPSVAPMACPTLPAEVKPWEITVWETGGGPDVEVYKEVMTDEGKSHGQLYPECEAGTCMLDLLKNGISCFAKPGPCADWFEDPTKTETYSCKYGSHTVALAECNVYGPSFKEDPKVKGDPVTGEPLPTPTGGNSIPGVVVTDPTNAGLCMAKGYSSVANPIEWVLVPVQCALAWAFQPRPLEVYRMNNELITKLDQTVLQDADELVTAYTAPFVLAEGDCKGPPFQIDIDLNQGAGMSETFYPLDACTGPMATFASFTYNVSGGIVLFGAGLAALRYFASIFGYVGPGMRANDDSSSVKFKAGKE